jgi:hypothetical protein
VGELLAFCFCDPLVQFEMISTRNAVSIAQGSLKVPGEARQAGNQRADSHGLGSESLRLGQAVKGRSNRTTRRILSEWSEAIQLVPVVVGLTRRLRCPEECQGWRA